MICATGLGLKLEKTIPSKKQAGRTHRLICSGGGADEEGRVDVDGGGRADVDGGGRADVDDGGRADVDGR